MRELSGVLFWGVIGLIVGTVVSHLVKSADKSQPRTEIVKKVKACPCDRCNCCPCSVTDNSREGQGPSPSRP